VPENEKEKKMSDISGRVCCEQLEKFNHVGLWARTFSALLIGQGDWYSTRCKLTWKLRGTKYGRMYCQLQVSALAPTEEIGFGLLPTPSCMQMDYEPKEGWTWEGNYWRDQNGKKKQTDLTTSVKMNGLLPTPTAMDSTNATATMKSSQVKEGSMHSVTLTRAMSMGMLPTPTVNEGKNATFPESQLNRSSLIGELMKTQDIGKTSQLNPLFVLEMMGFPPDWTELPFLNGETNQSKQQEMQ
jgi:hypothetical protein